MENTNQSLLKNQQFLLGLTSSAAIIGIIGMIVFGVMALGGDRTGGVANLGGTPSGAVAGETDPTVPAAPTGPVDLKISNDDHSRGDKNAKVVLLEWSDFQCPFCSRYEETNKRLRAEYGDKIRFVYRHFPLDSIHPQARIAAEASECAAEQGKFWEYHDQLFPNQASLAAGATYLKQLAGQLKLDQKKFDSCLDGGKYRAKVDAQYQAGIAAGVQGTPGSFLNGQALGGAVPYESLKPQIDALLNS